MDSDAKMSFATRLKNLRRKSNLTAAEAARRIGVSESTFRDWENGRSIKGEPYVKIAETFRVSLAELFGLDATKDLTPIKRIERIISELQFLRTELEKDDNRD